MAAPRPAPLRFKVEPRLVPADKAARRLHLTPAEFQDKLPQFMRRGFPAPEEVTGFYDLKKIDEWLDNPQPKLTLAPELRDAKDVVRDRVAGLKAWVR